MTPVKKKTKKTTALTKTGDNTTVSTKTGDDTLRLPPGALFTPVALLIPEDFPMNQWQKAGGTLKKLAKGTQWWVADWLNFGEARYGEKYSQYIEDLGLAAGTINNYQSIGGRMPPERRREELSFGHHESVLAVEDPALQDELLQKSIDENWTRDQLRQFIKELNKAAKEPGVTSKRKLDVKLEFEDEPAEESVERFKESVEKIMDKGQLGASGKIVTFSWHK